MRPLLSTTGQTLEARFTFVMPILAAGEYTVGAIADGTQLQHVQPHWIHDVLVVQSVSTAVPEGLVGIPMLKVSMDVEP